ncbi:hypothetical protein NC651_023472 [Populus alba x Populus x berolinensis]|nr:hypothetical protein NC651_023472 [Populus alba x Populus x berolinensis]
MLINYILKHEKKLFAYQILNPLSVLCIRTRNII